MALDGAIPEESSAEMLARFCARNLPVEMVVADDYRVMKSRLLGGPPGKDSSIFVEVPKLGAGGRTPLRIRDTVDVVVTFEGQRYGFRSVVERRARVRLAGDVVIPAFSISRPEFVNRLQRRRHYRVPVPVSEPIPVECTARSPAGPPESRLVTFQAPCVDISAGGMCLKLPGQWGGNVGRGMRFLLCFKLPSSRRIRVLCEVRHARPLRRGSVWLAGVEFLDMDTTAAGARASAAIARYVTRRQRDALRKKSGLE